MNTVTKVAIGVFVGLTCFALLALSGLWLYNRAVARVVIEEQEQRVEELQAQLQAQQDAIGEIIEEAESIKWQEIDLVDPITQNTSKMIARVENTDSPSNASHLFIKCQDNKTEMFVNWSQYIGTAARVVTRLDDTISPERGWEISSDGKATFFPTSPINTIKNMLDAERYVVRARTMRGYEYTAVFELEGLKEAVKPVREYCNW